VLFPEKSKAGQPPLHSNSNSGKKRAVCPTVIYRRINLTMNNRQTKYGTIYRTKSKRLGENNLAKEPLI